jgi:hypothetical protein
MIVSLLGIIGLTALANQIPEKAIVLLFDFLNSIVSLVKIKPA